MWRLYSKELWAKPWQFTSFCPLVLHLSRMPAGVLNKRCLSIKNDERLSGQPCFTVVSLILEGVLLNWKGGYCMERGWCGQYVCNWRWRTSSERGKRIWPFTLWYWWTCCDFCSCALSIPVNHLFVKCNADSGKKPPLALPLLQVMAVKRLCCASPPFLAHIRDDLALSLTCN